MTLKVQREFIVYSNLAQSFLRRLLFWSGPVRTQPTDMNYDHEGESSSSSLSSREGRSPCSSPVSFDPPSSPLPLSPPSPPTLPSPISSPSKRSPQSSPPHFQIRKRKRSKSLHEGRWSDDDLNFEDVLSHQVPPVCPEHEIDSEAAPIDTETIQDHEDIVEDFHGGGDTVMNRQEEENAEGEKSNSSFASTESSASGSALSDESSSSEGAISDLDCTQDSSDESNDDKETFHFRNTLVSGANSLTVDEAIVHVMDLYLEDSMKKKTLQSILDLVQKFLPKSNYMPKTIHILLKYVEDLYPMVSEKEHYYCKDCFLYLGDSRTKCSLCNCEVNNKFYQLSLANQIKVLFEHHHLANIIEDYSKRRNANASHGYSDILDGSEYKRARLSGRYDLTLLGHLDGVAVSKSSNMAMWALEFVICETPFHIRFKMILMAGIWMDSSKPILTSYMTPFFDEFDKLLEVGISWKHPGTNVVENSKISIVGFCADAPVRAQLQNILSHGGKYSCHTCEQKTEQLPAEPVLPGQKKCRQRRVFTFHEEDSPYRTSERMEHQAQVTIEQRRATGKLVPYKGVRGECVASRLPMCDRSTFVYPEYMHLLLGIVKQFFVLWFEVDGEWCLKNDRSCIDEFLESLRVPDFVTRIPRSTQSYVKWKANELRSFLIYFSLICLSGIMKEKYFQHWMLLVGGIYLLLQDVVSENDIGRAEVFFRMFLRDFTTLYRAQDFTYNLHQLLHLAVTVKRWGPLGCNSAFPLENFNGVLVNLIHGKRNQGKELSKTVRLIQSVNCLRARVKEESQQGVIGIEFCNTMKNFKFSAEQQVLINDKLNVNGPFIAYRRVKIGHQTYTTADYTRQVKRNNSTVCFSNESGRNSFGDIICLFRDTNSTIQMAFIRCFTVDHMRTFVHTETRYALKHIIPVAESNELALVSVSKIQFKVIRAGDFVCHRPNKYEINL